MPLYFNNQPETSIFNIAVFQFQRCPLSLSRGAPSVSIVYTMYLPLVFHARTTHPHAYIHRDTQGHYTEIHRYAHTHARAHRGREAHISTWCIYTPHTYKPIVVLFYLHNPNCKLCFIGHIYIHIILFSSINFQFSFV